MSEPCHSCRDHGGHDPRFHADTAFASAYKRPPGCDRNCVSHTVGLWADPYCFRRPEASQLSINVDIFFSAYPQFSMWRIDEHRRVDKRLAGFGPVEVLKRYEKWKDIARLCGPAGLRLIKGFRDEAPSGVWNGHRSCRLGLQCRAIYRVVADVLLIQVVDVNAHDCRKP